MTGRQLPSADYAGLKTAFRALIRAIGSQSDAAGVTRVQQQAISNYASASAEHADFFAPVDVVADLEAECGQPVVTAKLAELSGFELVPLPEGVRGVDPLALSGGAAKETGEFIAALGAAIADGSISTMDSAQISREGREAIAAIWRLIRSVEGDK